MLSSRSIKLWGVYLEFLKHFVSFMCFCMWVYMHRSDGNLGKSVLWILGTTWQQLPAEQSHRPAFGNLCVDFILEHH